MKKCPHCGEMISAGQEECFACGQPVRVRKRRSNKPANILLLVVGGAIILAAVVSFVAVQSGGARKRAAKAKELELLRVQDSVKKANLAVQDSVKSMMNTAQEISDLTAELRREEERFNTEYQNVTQGRPSPGQIQQAGEIQTQINVLRKLISSLGMTTRETERLQIRAKIKEVMGKLGELVDKLASAPRPRTTSRTQGTTSPEKDQTGKPPSGRRPHTKDGR